MRPVLFRYFARRIILSVLMAWLALVLLAVSFEILRALDEDDLLRAILLSLLKIPSLATEVVLFAYPIGVAVTIRRMVADSEMAALRTAGLAPGEIARMSCIAAFVPLAFYLLIDATLLPAAEQFSRNLKNETLTARGIWLKNDGDYIRIERIREDRTMEDIIIYRTDETELKSINTARRADYVDGQWRLETVRIRANEEERLTDRQLEWLTWELPINPDSFSVFILKPRDIPLWTATHAALSLSGGQVHHNLSLSIRRRWLTVIALPLLAAAGVWLIGNIKRRHHYAWSGLAAVLLGGVYFVLREISVQLSLLSDVLFFICIPPVVLLAFVWSGIRRG